MIYKKAVDLLFIISELNSLFVQVLLETKDLVKTKLSDLSDPSDLLYMMSVMLCSLKMNNMYVGRLLY